ncbi:MAG: folylpolyglutamate synthase/dihydrofolate synthase family protein [Actinomycetota bacterium]
MNFAEAVAELDSRHADRIVPDLDRITKLMEVLDEPQLTYPTIHVTGTNGKTTTSRLATSLACAHNLTTGLYTSPHLVSVTERISACGEPIPPIEFAQDYARLHPFLQAVDAISEETVSYFEVLTALAFLWFADKPVGLAVVEVGMGGRWDATNVVAGDVAIITPIALDHPELGPTIADKAGEKGDIIKEGKVAVVREQPPEALAIIQARAEAVGATLLLEDRDFGIEDRVRAVGGQVISVRGLHATYEDVMLTLWGPHAAHNAAAAIVALEAQFGRALDEDALRESFGSTTSPGRMEVVGRHPLVMFDGAHNPAGAAALADALEDSFTWERLILVTAVSGDKDLDGLMAPLASLAGTAIATTYSGGRAADPERVAEACRGAGILDVETAPSVEAAMDRARSLAGEGDLILVTGSLYTVADARLALG